MSSLREDQLQTMELQNELTKLRSAEQTSKLTADRIEELQSIIERLSAELENERKEKQRILTDHENVCREKDGVNVFFLNL